MRNCKNFALFILMAAVVSGGVMAQSTASPPLSGDNWANSSGEARAFTPAASKSPAKFAKAVSYKSFWSSSVAVADVNGDGKPDLVVSDWCHDKSCNGGDVGVMLAKGDGTFDTPIIFNSGGAYAYSVAIGDVNGDGKPDFVVANDCLDINCNPHGVVLGVQLGKGDGTFQSVATYTIGGVTGSAKAQTLALGDVNGDGRLDLVVASGCESGQNCHGIVSVLLGKGDGTFQPPVNYNSAGTMTNSAAIGDVNGDGHADLVVAEQCQSINNCDAFGFGPGGVSVLLGNGDGTFQSPVSYSSGGTFGFSVAIGDLNGDGKPDVVVTNGCKNACNDSVHSIGGSVGVLLGSGNGSFQAPVSYSSGGFWADSIAIGDVNGDGHPDIAVANQCKGSSPNGSCRGFGEASVLAGNGDGAFQAATSFVSGGKAAVSIAIGDVNGDTKPDLIVANLDFRTSSVGVLLNILTYSTATAVSSSQNPSQINQPVTFTATTTSAPPVPDGETVTFYSGTTKIGTGTTKNGTASLTTSFSKARTYTIKATYGGDAFHNVSSGKVKQVVNP